MTRTRAELRRDNTHEWAKHEHRFYREHGRPSRPYYQVCYACDESWECERTLLDADYSARRHAGYHGGLKNERAQVVVTDANGKELFTIHAGHIPGSAGVETCPACETAIDPDRVTCPECGRIPPEHRLTADGGGRA